MTADAGWAETDGGATWCAMFSVRPRPADMLHVCTDLACAASGAADLCAGVEAPLVTGRGLDAGSPWGTTDR
jgi:NADH-quinone oxidoreductase subunit F